MTRTQAPGPFAMFGGEREFIPLLGQPRQFLVAAEVVRRDRQRLFPALYALAERPVDVFKRLRRSDAGLAVAVKDAPRCDLLPGLIAQECVFERHLIVARIEAHGLCK